MRRRYLLQALPLLAVAPAWPSSPVARRLVTVGGGITEAVYALDAQGVLVGTDTTSLYPAAAQATPKVGYLRQLSAEGLLSLRPSALVAPSDAGPPVVIDQLRSAGVQVMLVRSQHNWQEVRDKVRTVGEATGQEAAARALQARLDAQWAETLARVNGVRGTPPRVLFVLAHSGSPQVSGEGTAADAMIRFAGGRNALGGFKGYRPMTSEAMAQAAPDVILTTTQSLDASGGEAAFWQRPELALTPAWQRRASGHGLVHMDALALLGFGPRMPQTTARLHERLHGA